MERSGSQKALLVISIIEIVLAILALIAGFAMMFLTGAVAGLGSSQVAQAGLTPDDQALGTAALSLVTGVIIISAIWSLLCGIFGIRAANDNQKIMIVWVFTLIGVILGVVGAIYTIVNGSFGQQAFSLIASLAVDVIMFWIANNIKKEAGK